MKAGSNAKRRKAGSLQIVTIEIGSYLKRLGRRKPVTFQFEPGVNVLAGPNGCGKSSLIEAIFGNAEMKRTEPPQGVTVESTKGTYFAFDFEKDNPRTKDPHFQPPSMFGFALSAHLGTAGSHGQITLGLSQHLREHAGEALFVLDEPDQALDFESTAALVEIMKEAANSGSQVIAAAHHPLILLEPSFNVIEMKRGYLAGVRQHLKGLLR